MGKAPKAPDPYQQAAAQRQENTWTSQYNTIGQNANQITPYGTVSNAPGSKIPIYDQNGNVQGYGTQWNQTTTLSPQEQAIFNQEQNSRLGLGKFANQQIGTLSDVLGKPFNTEGLPSWQLYGQGPELRQAEYGGTDRAAIEDAMMQSYQRGIAPQQQAQDVQMAARGMGAPGSEMAYAVANQRADAAGEQTRQAYLASGEEARQQAGEARLKQTAANQALQQAWINANARADQQNNVRQGQFGERQQTRNQIVNEIAALLGGSQVQIPQGQAFQGSAVNPFDIAGAQNQAYTNAMAAHQNKQSGLFGIAGGILSMINPFLGAGATALFKGMGK
jgi:hypothetical protein